MNATRKQLEAQFKRVVDADWLHLFIDNAKRAGTTTAHELALGSRETNLKNIKGDFRDGKYHGFGVLQVDIGTDPEYARNWTPDLVEPSIRRGTDIYIAKLNDTKACVGSKVMVRNRSFVGKAVENDDLRRIATAAYNCGRWAHYHFSRGENMDSTTTGKDYSRDVYDRAVHFADMLEKANLEKGAVGREMALQGKYARSTFEKLFGVAPSAPRVKLPHGPSQESDEELNAADYARDAEFSAELVGDPADSTPQNKSKIVEGELSADTVADQVQPTLDGGPKEASAQTNLPTSDAVSVQQIVPEKTEEKPTGIKATIAAGIAFLTSLSGGIFSLFQGASGQMIFGFFGSATIVGVVFIVARTWTSDRDKKRQAAAQEAREQRAHELQVLTVKSAMDRTVNTVQIVPQPIQNTDPPAK